MATFADNLIQQVGEIHTYTIDFSNDLPSGGTVTAGTATHYPPYGAGSAITVTVSSPYLYATLPNQSIIGQHYLDVLATFNNGDKSSARVPISVAYASPVARQGMLSLILELRGMAEAGPSDYLVGGQAFWADAQLQDILDMHRQDMIFEQLSQYPTMDAGGEYIYKEYRSAQKFYEQSTGGTAIFYVQNSGGSTIPSSDYSVDYRKGQIIFNQDQEATLYYLTGRSFDLNAAAADIWRRKAAHYASAFDFSTDNHNVSRSQLYQHCLEMAAQFENMGKSAIQFLSLYRGDIPESEDD